MFAHIKKLQYPVRVASPKRNSRISVRQSSNWNTKSAALEKVLKVLMGA